MPERLRGGAGRDEVGTMDRCLMLVGSVWGGVGQAYRWQITMSGSQIPGFSEISDWPVKPTPPFTIVDFGAYRDGGPRCTFYVDLTDSAGHKYSFFFERFLGRLCFGTTNDEGEDAAFVRVGSVLERDVLTILETAIDADSKYSQMREFVERAKHWSPSYR
jgi:hypothetical protein